MKYIVRYNKFNESVVEIDDVKDMLSYLSDDQFNIQVKEGDHHVFSECVEVTISRDGGDFYFWNEGDIGELTPFKVKDVKEYLQRVYKYMISEGWESFNFEIVTYNKIESSKTFRDGTYSTSVGIDDNKLYSTMYSDMPYSPEYANKIISDDQIILCVYIGFGKD